MNTYAAADTVRVAGSGPPVVFVNGSFSGPDSWDPVVSLLPDFDCRTYARRNYPPHAVDAVGNTFADDAAELAEVIAATGGGAHIVGAAHGATIALHAALAGVGMTSLTIFEPPLYAAGPVLAPTLDRVRSSTSAGRFGDAAQTFLREVAQMPASLVGDADDSVEPLLPGAISDLEAMVTDTADLDRWGALVVPVQLMQGELTWSPMPETMTALLAALPAGTGHHVFAGQSHFATHTAPDEFAAVVRDFILTHGG